MAFTREFLKAMGLTEEQVSAIMAAHVEVTTGLKAIADQHKADAEKLPGVQAQLDEANKQLEAANKNEYEALYKTEHAAFEKYKTDVATKETERAKQDICRGLLREAGIPEKRVEAVLRLVDLSKLEVDDKNQLTDRKKALQDMKTEFSDYIVTAGQKKDTPDNPPHNAGTNSFKSLSLAEKMEFASQNPTDTQVVEWLKNPTSGANDKNNGSEGATD